MKLRLLIVVALLAAFAACKRTGDNHESKVDLQFGDNHDMIRKPQAEIDELIKESKAKLKDGDLIMRSDDGIESESLRSFSTKDKSFSHCGIVFIENDTPVVYHNMAGDENPTENLLRQTFDYFVDSKHKTGFGVFQYSLTPEETEKLHNLSKEYLAKGLKFDKTFDLKTDDKMYCAEMIYKFLRQATNGRMNLPTTTIKNFRVRDPKYKGLVLKEFVYVALDNLYLNPFCKELTRVAYFTPKVK
jgi:hypothetical protein